MLARVEGNADRGAETEPAREKAPRLRRALAVAIDMGLWSAPFWVARRRMRPAGSGTGESEWARRARQAARPGWTVLEQQLGTPGQWIAGVRTVDRRTGRRVAPWRSLVLAAFSLARGELTRRLWSAARPSPVDAQERAREVRVIVDAHRDDEEATHAALFDYHRDDRIPDPNGAHLFLVPLALGVLESQLGKRLAPTVVVLRSDRATAD